MTTQDPSEISRRIREKKKLNCNETQIVCILSKKLPGSNNGFGHAVCGDADAHVNIANFTDSEKKMVSFVVKEKGNETGKRHTLHFLCTQN